MIGMDPFALYEMAGWTIVHSLWQGALLGVFVWLTLQAFAKHSSNLRYAIACTGLILFTILPMVTMMWLFSSSHSTNRISHNYIKQPSNRIAENVTNSVDRTVAPSPQMAPPVNRDIAPGSIFSPSSRNAPSTDLNSIPYWLTSSIDQVSPWLAYIWAIGVAVLSLRLFAKWGNAQKLKSQGRVVESSPVNAILNRLKSRLGISKAVELREAAGVDSPMVIGWIKPVVIMPISALTGLNDEQLSAVFAHELAHIKRNDYVVNVGQSIFEILLFYHPVVWWLSGKIRAERENCCDDVAVKFCSNRRDYVEALLQLEEQRDQTALAISANGGSLLERVARVLDEPRIKSGGNNWVCGLISLSIAIAVLTGGFPQQPSEGQESGRNNKQVADFEDTESDSQYEFTILVVNSNGDAIPDAKLFLNVREEGPPAIQNHNLTTDSNGFVSETFTDRTIGVRVWCSARGYAPLVASWEPDFFRGDKNLPPEFTFIMMPATTIGGEIVDTEGLPIAGAKVEASLRGGGIPLRGNRQRYSSWLAYGDGAVVTDGSGRWSLDNVPPGDDVNVSLTINHPDYVSDENSGDSQRRQNIRMKDLAAQTASIVMNKGASAHGSVVDAQTKKPVSNAVIIWGDNPYLQSGSQETRVDKAGEYQIPTMKPGPKRITVVAKGYQPESEIVKFHPKMNATDFQLKPGKKLQIKFVDPQGNPIPDVYVSVDTWRGTKALYTHRHPNVIDLEIPIRSDRDGFYTWNGAPSDKVSFSFGAKKFASKRGVELAAADQPHVIELAPKLYVSGTVQNENGEDIEAFTVVPMTVLSGGAIERREDAFIRTDGFFEITFDREDAGFQVKIEADGYQTHFTKVFRAGDEFEPLEIVLHAVDLLEYEVVDIGGTPASEANTMVANGNQKLIIDYHENGELLDYTGKKNPTNKAGKFKLAPATAPRTLMVRSENGYGEVADTAEKPATKIRLKKWLEVSGKASVEGEFDGVRVSARPIRFIHGQSYHIQQSHSSSTDYKGNFKFNKLPPMPFALLFNRSRDTDPQQRRYLVAVEPNKASIEVEFGCQVTGQVVVTGGNRKDVSLKSSRVNLRSIQPTVTLPPELSQLIKKHGLDANDEEAVRKHFKAKENFHALNPYSSCFDSYSILLDESGKFDLRLMRPGVYEMTVELNPHGKKRTFLPLGEFIQTVKVTKSGVDLGEFSASTFPSPARGASIDNLKFINRKTDLPTWLNSLKGKFVLIDFWKPWDEHSKADAERLGKIARDLDHRKVTILSLHTYNRSEGNRIANGIPNSLQWIDGKVPYDDLRAFRKSLGALTPQYYLLIDPLGNIISGSGELAKIDKALKTAIANSNE